MAGRSLLLPVVLLAAAAALLLCGAPAFVGGQGPTARAGVRSATARGAVPPGAEGLAET
eukprot:CAMPEP_0175447622 /NCGR_PEP_ID=MMETSP0095-20121207/60905_1 /TAXON_ID=311494 /ORGANISM="Alexandrium monilatum, Strain CCMP3105" /LENGTH=58 /DNA_ID=CAMNT_0016747981 /DNA_START=72 /DNA_END=244 /DNA_ORIENTATION=+